MGRKRKMNYSRAIALFLTSVVLVQVVLLLLALFSLLLPYITTFFYANLTPTLAFWIFLTIAIILSGISIYLLYVKSRWSYVSFLSSGILLGVIFAIALMSVFIF